MYVYTPVGGETIDKAAAHLVSLANLYGGARMKFNDVTCDASKGDTAGQIVKGYRDACQARSAAYQRSPKGIAAAAKRQADIKRKQAEVNRLEAELATTDLSDVATAVRWLVAYTDPAGDTGVACSKSKVLEVFAAAGHTPNQCLGGRVRTDRDFAGRYLVGQGLDGIRTMGAPHDLLIDWGNKWLKNRPFGGGR
jgi:hypothetical protein